MELKEIDRIKDVHRHNYLLMVPEKLWFLITKMANERDISVRSMILLLIREGIKIELSKEEKEF